ncbi:MAG: hypothetical protein HYT80_01880 [Euryarchaeota archaeon]|nr:hypothetical protein [Euryarchaeota archaeon]
MIEWDPSREIRRRRRIMMGKGEGREGAPTPAPPGAPPAPPMGPAERLEFVGITKAKLLLAVGVGVPRPAAFMFFGIRLLAGFLWLVNGLVKNPWNGWGYFPEWTEKFAENSPIPPYKWFLDNVVSPNLWFWGWVQFLVEVGLGILLVVGLCTGFAGLVATAWAANIFIGSVFVPGEWVWGLLAFLAIMPLCWATRAGRYLGADAFLRPQFLTDKRPMVRWIAKWTM